MYFSGTTWTVLVFIGGFIASLFFLNNHRNYIEDEWFQKIKN